MGFVAVAVPVVVAAAGYLLLDLLVLPRIDRRRFEGSLWRAEALSQRLRARDRLTREDREGLTLVLGKMSEEYGLLRAPDRRRYDPRLTRMYVLAASNGIDFPAPGR